MGSAGQPLNDEYFMDMAIDPFDPDVLYIGTSRLGILKSTDAGQTWKAINNGIKPNESKNIQ